jgi:hypothetical protein
MHDQDHSVLVVSTAPSRRTAATKTLQARQKFEQHW